MKITSPIASLRTIAAAVAVLALSGCATFSKDGGLDAVSALTAERTGQDVRLLKGTAGTEAAQAELDQMLKQPLSADGAVHVALLNNRGLHAVACRTRHRRGRPGAGRPHGQSGLQLQPHVRRRRNRDRAQRHVRPGRPADHSAAPRYRRRGASKAPSWSPRPRPCAWRPTPARPGSMRSRRPSRRAMRSRCARRPRPVPNWRSAWPRWATCSELDQAREQAF